MSPKLKQELKEALTFAMLISALVLIVIFSIMRMEDNKRIQSLQQANGALNAQLNTYKTTNGHLVTEKQAAELRVKELKEAMPRLADEITKSFDIKLKNLRAYMQSSFQAQGSGQAKIIRDTLHVRDSIQNPYGFSVISQDGYLDHTVDINSQFDTPYHYTYSDTIKQAFTMKGKWYQKKHLYGQATLSNPNAIVTNTDAVLINEYKDKRFGIGPYIGWGLNNKLQPQTTVGISFHYSLIKF